MPLKSLGCSVIRSILCSLLLIGQLAAATQQQATKISWQILQPKSLPESKHLLAISAPEDSPVLYDSVFGNRQFTLAENQSVLVKLPARHWFYLEMADNRPSESTPLPINIRVSSSPGLAQKLKWRELTNILPPASGNRIVEISHTGSEDIHFTLAMGTSIDNQTFAPLSWLDQNSECFRFYSSALQHQDFCSAEQVLSFDLEKDKIYWLEGIQQVGTPWSRNHSQLWTWRNKELQHSDEDYSQLLFSTASRKQLYRLQDTDASPHLNLMRPGVFQTKKDAKARLMLDKHGFVRVQSSDADWLFNKNYQHYAVPDLKQRLQQAALSQQLHQQLLPDSKVSPQQYDISDFNQLATINSWLSWQDMTPIAAGGIKQKLIHSQRLNWDFTSEQEPDLSLDNISLPNLRQKQRFNELQPGKPITWVKPKDAVNNQVQLQIINQKTSQKPGNYTLLVDDKVFAEFTGHNPPEILRWAQDLNWQLATQSQPNTAKSAVQVMTLPQGWRKLELVTDEVSALVRIRYRKPAYPKLDAPQWHTWLQEPREPGQIPDDIKAHPHWLALRHYLDIKQGQFTAEAAPPFWQELITTGVTATELFDLPFPQGMAGYQNLQSHLLNPQVNQWQYWQQVLTQLRHAGWPGYANDLSSALIRFHAHPQIVEQAARDYFEQLNLAQNTSPQIAMLSYLIFSGNTKDTFRDLVVLSLAKLLLQENRPDSALFLLGFAQDSAARTSLVHESAKAEGYLSLAASYQPVSTPLFEGSLLSNELQQLNFDALQSITGASRIQLYNPELNTRQNNLLVTANSPLELELPSGAELELEVRLWFGAAKQPEQEVDDWLNIEFAGQHKLVPLFNNAFRSEGLLHPEASVGIAHRFRVSTPGAGKLVIFPNHHSISVNIKEVSHAPDMQLVESECHRDNTWLTQDFYTLWRNTAEKSTNKKLPGNQFHCMFVDIQKTSPGTFSVEEADNLIDESDYQTLLSRLQQFESSPDNKQLAALNQTLHEWPDSALQHKLLKRLNHHARWQVQNNPMRVKKSSFYQANTNTPLTPAGFRGRLLYTPFKPEWEKLSENSALNYSLEIGKSQKYRLRLLSQNHLFLKENFAEVGVRINDQTTQRITLKLGQETSIELPFSVGTQTLSIQLFHSKEQASVLAQLQFREEGSSWQTQPQTVGLKLFQADEQQPFQQYFPETAWLRIESFNSDGMSNHTFVMAQKGIFSWFPQQAAPKVIGHRIYRLQLPPEQSDAVLASASVLNPANQEQQKPDDSRIAGTFPRFTFLPELPEIQQQNFINNPWGLELSQQQRRTPAEDFAQNNRFWQLQIYRQQADEQQDLSSRYDIAVRSYDSDFSESLHGSYQWWNQKWWHNLDLNMGFRFAAQDGFADEGLAWSSRLHAETHWQYSINRRLFNRFSARLWGNLIDSGKDTQQFATAVYSQYKLDHRYGLRLTESIRYKWHHDLESWAQFILNSNPFSQSDLLDNGILVLGSRLFYQGLVADIRWRYQSFKADRHRPGKSKDSRLALALDWFTWQKTRHFRVRFGYDRNLTANENYWSLRFSWNASDSRGVRDYMPQSLAFSELRQQQFNNEVFDFEGEP